MPRTDRAAQHKCKCCCSSRSLSREGRGLGEPGGLLSNGARWGRGRSQWRDCLPGLRELVPGDSWRRYSLAGQESIFSLREKAVRDIQGCSELVRREADGGHNKQTNKQKNETWGSAESKRDGFPLPHPLQEGHPPALSLTLGPRTLHTH